MCWEGLHIASSAARMPLSPQRELCCSACSIAVGDAGRLVRIIKTCRRAEFNPRELKFDANAIANAWIRQMTPLDSRPTIMRGKGCPSNGTVHTRLVGLRMIVILRDILRRLCHIESAEIPQPSFPLMSGSVPERPAAVKGAPVLGAA